jgi:hypothetical protein
MKCVLKTKQLTGQVAVIETYGDKFWEWLCNEFPDSFTIDQAMHAPVFKGLTSDRVKRDYARTILLNVQAEYDANRWGAAPELGRCPFDKVGRLFVWNK